jgi:hypothetical protein
VHTLKIKEHVIGVIVIYKLLIQKQTFAELDYELFTLLAGHSATAPSVQLYSSRTQTVANSRVIDLLTK